MAARAGQVEVVRCLLRNGAMVDARARVRPPSPVLPQRRHQRRVLTTCVPPGGPDATSHRVPPGEDGDRAAAAAAHGSPRRSHHQRVHPPPHLRPGGPAGDRLRPDGGRSVPLTSHQGQDGGRGGGWQRRQMGWRRMLFSLHIVTIMKQSISFFGGSHEQVT